MSRFAYVQVPCAKGNLKGPEWKQCRVMCDTLNFFCHITQDVV